MAADRSIPPSNGRPELRDFGHFEMLICADRIWPECLNQDIWPLQYSARSNKTLRIMRERARACASKCRWHASRSWSRDRSALVEPRRAAAYETLRATRSLASHIANSEISGHNCFGDPGLRANLRKPPIPESFPNLARVVADAGSNFGAGYAVR